MRFVFLFCLFVVSLGLFVVYCFGVFFCLWQLLLLEVVKCHRCINAYVVCIQLSKYLWCPQQGSIPPPGRHVSLTPSNKHLCQSMQLLLEVTLNAYAQGTEFFLFYLASSVKRWDLNLNDIFKCNLFFFSTESDISSPVENISFSKQFEDNVKLSSTDLVKLQPVNACDELIQH